MSPAPRQAAGFSSTFLSVSDLHPLDKVRRDQVRLLGGPKAAGALKKSRWALLKNPWNLDADEHEKLADVQRTNRPLYRAYLLKESLAEILGRHQVNVVRGKLNDWISWAARSRLPAFKRLARTLRGHLDGVLAFVATGLTNGPIEGLNGKIEPSPGVPTVSTALPASSASSSSAAPASPSTPSSRRRIHTHYMVRRAKKMWCVPEIDQEFVVRMEEVLRLHARPYRASEPVVCLDERPVQLLDPSRPSVPMRSGAPKIA